MIMKFYKYHGTANDFVMIDNRLGDVNLSSMQVAKLCNRRTGIGADGLILLQNHDRFDFQMIYYNADGSESTMCGNGGRCIVAFAQQLEIVKKEACFLAIDGVHHATIYEDKRVALEMISVEEVNIVNDDYVLDTGSPHYVQFCTNLEDLDVFTDGSAIRNSSMFMKEGINVNFVEVKDDILHIRTYERGVEDETWSCGTGVVACSIAYAKKQNLSGHLEVIISTKGGELKVKFNISNDVASNVWLIGPAICVYEGDVEL